MKAIGRQPGAGSLDHRSGAAQVHVGVAAGQHRLVEQVGDQPGAPGPVVVAARHDDVHLQARNTVLELFEFVELAQIFGRGHSIEQTYRLAGIGRQTLGHGQDC